MPLPLRGVERQGPWSQVELAPGAFHGVDAVVKADTQAGAPGVVRVASDDPFVLLATPPAWPGLVPDEAPGAPRGDASAFGQAREDVLLAACYASALAAAERAGVQRLGFASLGSAHRDHPFPPERAAKIALGHAVGHFTRRPPPEHPQRVVFFVDEAELRVYRHLIDTRAAWAAGRRRA